MITRLKRVYSYFIELLAVCVLFLFVYEFIGLQIYSMVHDSYKASFYSYMYLRPILMGLIILYLLVRNLRRGASVLQKIFGICHQYESKKQLLFKNVVDFLTLPITFVAILVFNKSIGDMIFKTGMQEHGNGNKGVFVFMLLWFTLIPVIFGLGYSWRVTKSAQEFIFHLNNSETIKEQVGVVQKFSFNNPFFWMQYDKDGEYIGAKVVNHENKKFKIKLYHNLEGSSTFSYFVIDGKKYEYETEHFSVEEYLERIEKFKDEIHVSEITNEKEALQAADEAYEIYFSSKRSGYVGSSVYYDSENDCWLVDYVSSFDYSVLGGDCAIILKGTGEVLLIELGK